MPSNFEKFLFLGIIVALALFSRVAYPTFYPAEAGPDPGRLPPATGSERAPLFILPSADGPKPGARSEGLGTSSLQAANFQPPTSTAAVPPVPAAVLQSQTAMVASAFTPIGSAPPPEIADQASLIADLQAGSVLYGVNTDRRWPLASLTKLMTATIVMDKLDLNQKVAVTPAAVAVDPKQTTLQAGDVYTVSDLLRVLLLPSSNVAAEALANAGGSTSLTAGGRAVFLAEMNARAQAWGMASTHYDDPSGLSVGNQSTAADLLRLAQKIYADYPQILAITRTPQVTIKELGSGRTMDVASINNFAGRADFIGGKTGYTDEAVGNLLSIFKYEGQPVLVVVLGTDDGGRFTDSLQLYQWFISNFK